MPRRLVRDHGVGHALLADQRGQRAGVDAGEADDAARLQPVVEVARRAIVRRRGDVGVQDDAAGARRRRHVDRLDVVLVGADIADVREGEGDDLPGIGRIGEDLLVAGHRGVEADLADRVAGGAEAKAFQHGAVGQHQKRRRLGLSPSVAGGGPGGARRRLGHGLLVAYYMCRSKGALSRSCGYKPAVSHSRCNLKGTIRWATSTITRKPWGNCSSAASRGGTEVPEAQNWLRLAPQRHTKGCAAPLTTGCGQARTDRRPRCRRH